MWGWVHVGMGAACLSLLLVCGRACHRTHSWNLCVCASTAMHNPCNRTPVGHASSRVTLKYLRQHLNTQLWLNAVHKTGRAGSSSVANRPASTMRGHWYKNCKCARKATRMKWLHIAAHCLDLTPQFWQGLGTAVFDLANAFPFAPPMVAHRCLDYTLPL
jgi:hypothetical protein